jgi:hypothetical protein
MIDRYLQGIHDLLNQVPILINHYISLPSYNSSMDLILHHQPGLDHETFYLNEYPYSILVHMPKLKLLTEIVSFACLQYTCAQVACLHNQLM